MTGLPTIPELLLEWDRRRPRSQQQEIGMSELGDCRRRFGYRLAGVAPTNPGGSVQAVIGTAVHLVVAQAARELQASGVIPRDALIEHEVHFAGFVGHLDLFVSPTLYDVKTTTSRWLGKLRVDGPSRSHLWQVHAYGAALLAAGHTVPHVVLDYLARDTGDHWRWTGPFEPRHVRDALAWVRGVQDTPPEFLPRDHDPDSSWCKNCPFRDRCWQGGIPGRDPRTVLYLDNPDAADWARRLEDARHRRRQAEEDEKTARGALDALRPGDSGGLVAVPGLDKVIRFSVTHRKRIDTDQVRRDYAAAGRQVPLKKSSPEVRIELVDPAALEGTP